MLFDGRVGRSVQVVNVDGDSVLVVKILVVIVLVQIAARTQGSLLARRSAAPYSLVMLILPLVEGILELSATYRVSIVAILAAIVGRGGGQMRVFSSRCSAIPGSKGEGGRLRGGRRCIATPEIGLLEAIVV